MLLQLSSLILGLIVLGPNEIVVLIGVSIELAHVALSTFGACVSPMRHVLVSIVLKPFHPLRARVGHAFIWIEEHH